MNKKPENAKGQLRPTNIKKTKLVIVLAAVSFLLPVAFFWELLYGLPSFLTVQHLYFRCGWLVALCLGGYALKLMQGWDPKSFMTLIVLIVACHGVALGLLWFAFAISYWR